MTDFQLGDKVTVTDFMVRLEVGLENFEELVRRWPDVPDELILQHDAWVARSKPRYQSFRMWVPGSAEAKGWLGSRASKHHPAPWAVYFKFPVEAFVTRKVTASCGIVTTEEYGTLLEPVAYTTMYEVSYHLSRVPLRVLPTMITKIES